MKYISQILNVLLAIALLFMVIKLVKVQKETPVTSSDCVDAMEVIMTRTSVRSYTDRPVSDAQVEQMLRAAMAAPSARNMQPWSFVVINDAQVKQSLTDSLPYATMLSGSPMAIAVCGDLSKALPGAAQEYWVQDVSAAVENLLLAAHALGLGAVWTGVYPIQERVDAVSGALGLPKDVVPLAVIPIGYPAGEQMPKDKWKPEHIHYNGWE